MPVFTSLHLISVSPSSGYCTMYIVHLSGAGHATMLSRQRDHVFRPQLANPSGHRDLNTFANFFWSTRLYYVVTLSLSRSYKIVACPALSLSTAMLLLLLLGFLTWRVSFPSCLSCCSWGSCNNNNNHSY